MVFRRYGTGDASPLSTVRMTRKRTRRVKNLMIASIVIVLMLDECGDTVRYVGSKGATVVVVMLTRERQEGFVERMMLLLVLWKWSTVRCDR
jgi:hypothetical protein